MAAITKASVNLITDDYLIVCEGSGDVAFVKYLCRERTITGYCVEETGSGNSGFYRYFDGLHARSDADRLKGVIVISDNDEAPDKSFDAVRSQLKKAKVPHPDNPMEIARQTSLGFCVMVMMVPFSTAGRSKGCLETILLEAAVDRYPALAKCVQEYSACAGATGWAKCGSIDKLRLRCLLSAAVPEDPNLGLQYALNPDRGLIPLGAACFDEIANELRQFIAKVR